MAKICIYPGCKWKQFGGRYCKGHQGNRSDVQLSINKVSDSQSTELQIYSVISKDYLNDHPVCQCGREGCQRPAVEVHHIRGRGIWLNVVRYFLAVARECHDWIHAHPKEARLLGLLYSKHYYERQEQNTMDRSDMESMARML